MVFSLASACLSVSTLVPAPEFVVGVGRCIVFPKTPYTVCSKLHIILYKTLSDHAILKLVFKLENSKQMKLYQNGTLITDSNN